MDLWEALEGRHSVRLFRSQPVADEVMKRVLHAAVLAPSAFNSQPWRFHVTRGSTRISLGTLLAQATVHLAEYMEMLGPERYQEAINWYSSLGDAPVILGVSVPRAESELDEMNKLISVGAAVENLMLAATDEGLGTCVITFAWWVKDELAELLDIGDDRQMVALLAVGYPRDTVPASPPHSNDVAVWYD